MIVKCITLKISSGNKGVFDRGVKGIIVLCVIT